MKKFVFAVFLVSDSRARRASFVDWVNTATQLIDSTIHELSRAYRSYRVELLRLSETVDRKVSEVFRSGKATTLKHLR